MSQEIEINQEEGGCTYFVFMLGWKVFLEAGRPQNEGPKSELKYIA